VASGIVNHIYSNMGCLSGADGHDDVKEWLGVFDDAGA
jgi:hypothetical protein